MARIHRRTVQKDLHDQDNHDGVITHLEPDILECEVKWALESITTNKASGGDGIPVELFQILKDDAVKVLHSICQQIWTTQQWPQDWKSQFSFQSRRKAMPKNAQTPAELHSSSCIGEGNGNPLQCSCLENHRDGGAAVSGVAQSQTRLKRLAAAAAAAHASKVMLKILQARLQQYVNRELPDV